MRFTVLLALGFAALALHVGCGNQAAEVEALDATAGVRQSSALSWGSPVNVDNQKGGTNRDGTSLAVVNGNPAVAYIRWDSKTSKYNLHYKRASNATGSAWSGSVKTIAAMPATQGGINCYCSLLVVDGNPAIAYSDMTGLGSPGDLRDLRYVRATDATGNNWGQPLTVNEGGYAFAGLVMKIVNGNPAIAYINPYPTGQRTVYVRATNATGTAWGAAVIPYNTASNALTASLETVNGHPAISYYVPSLNETHYLRAADANGDSWGTPQVVLSMTRNSKLVVANGHPALLIQDPSINGNAGLSYLRALDPDGTSWPAQPTVLDNSGFVTAATTCLVNGLPAVSYLSAGSTAGPFTLTYIQALDADGSSWEARQAVADVGSVQPIISLAQVENGAGIAYSNASRAKIFVRGQ